MPRVGWCRLGHTPLLPVAPSASESRVPVLRVTTMGISARIEADGRLVGRVEEGVQDSLHGALAADLFRRRSRPGWRT
jgi:hypothetical protein